MRDHLPQLTDFTRVVCGAGAGFVILLGREFFCSLHQHVLRISRRHELEMKYWFEPEPFLFRLPSKALQQGSLNELPYDSVS